MLYKVKEIAAKLGVATSAVRYYDSLGLVPSSYRTETGRRRLDEKDYEYLKLIEGLTKSGSSLSEVIDFTALVKSGDATIEERLNYFKQKKENVLKFIEELNDINKTLDYYTWYYEKAQELGSTKAVDELSADEIPADLRAGIDRLQIK